MHFDVVSGQTGSLNNGGLHHCFYCFKYKGGMVIKELKRKTIEIVVKVVMLVAKNTEKSIYFTSLGYYRPEAPKTCKSIYKSEE